MKNKIKISLAVVLCCAMLFCGNIFASSSITGKTHEHSVCYMEESEIARGGLGYCPQCFNFGVRSNFLGWGDWTFQGTEACSGGSNRKHDKWQRRGTRHYFCTECNFEYYDYPVDVKFSCGLHV